MTTTHKLNKNTPIVIPAISPALFDLFSELANVSIATSVVELTPVVPSPVVTVTELVEVTNSLVVEVELFSSVVDVEVPPVVDVEVPLVEEVLVDVVVTCAAVELVDVIVPEVMSPIVVGLVVVVSAKC